MQTQISSGLSASPQIGNLKKFPLGKKVFSPRDMKWNFGGTPERPPEETKGGLFSSFNQIEEFNSSITSQLNRVVQAQQSILQEKKSGKKRYYTYKIVEKLKK